MKIASIHAREILDSRGNPTVEADVVLENGLIGRAAVPSGASTGTHEAVELRDGDPKRYGGKGVLKAVGNVNGDIAKALVGADVFNQKEIDGRMIALDGTPTKSNLGANAILAVSLAAAKAGALASDVPLFSYAATIAGLDSPTVLPVPLMNIVNGGRHAAGSTDIQEFMVVPVGAPSCKEAVRMGAEIFHALQNVLAANGYGTTVGDEGGYALGRQGLTDGGAAGLRGNEAALELIMQAIQEAGYAPGKDIALALDVAASELVSENGYELKTENKKLETSAMISWLGGLAKRYPIISIEDGLGENDWAGWTEMAKTLSLQLVGDDLLVTNTEFLKRAIDEKAANAILIKPNQIGTLSETVAAVAMAKAAGWRTILSHRSGETEDTTIAHLAVGLGTSQIKTGSLSRGERTAKYNELLRIEEGLGTEAKYRGAAAFE